MRRLPAPVETFVQKTRYQEDHSGFPVLVRIFMGAARQAGYLIWGILLVGSTVLWTSFLGPDQQWAFRFGISFFTVQVVLLKDVFPWSPIDILGHVGFLFFHRLIRQ